MLVIKDLIEEIYEELDGARGYAENALKLKDKDKSLSEMYISMAKEELGHMNRLHDQIVRIISEYRIKNGEAPKGMEEIYEWQHQKIIQCSAEIKVLIESYK